MYIRTVWNSPSAHCLRFTNLYGYSSGKVMDHREYFGSTNFTKKSVFSKIEMFKIYLINITNFRFFKHALTRKHIEKYRYHISIKLQLPSRSCDGIDNGTACTIHRHSAFRSDSFRLWNSEFASL